MAYPQLKPHKVAVFLDDEMYEALRDKAQDEQRRAGHGRVSMSMVIEYCIRKVLQKKPVA